MIWYVLELADWEIGQPPYLKRIDLAPSNFATYYPSILTRYSNQNISRETNKFMKEPHEILGLCFWYIEIHRVWPIFGWLNHYIYPNTAILSLSKFASM